MWSPDGRYVASAQRDGKHYRLWVIDTTTGRFACRRDLPPGDVYTVRWLGPRKVQAGVNRPGGVKPYSLRVPGA